MNNYLPGTKLIADLHQKRIAHQILDNIFATGGLILSQVSKLTGVESYTIQNWVKRGFCTSPVSKKYNREQFCRLITINMLKESMPICEVTRLLSYINGNLHDTSDDIIDDDELYFYFVDVLSKIDVYDIKSISYSIDSILCNFVEPVNGGKVRLYKVLEVMCYAYISTFLKHKASDLIQCMRKDI